MTRHPFLTSSLGALSTGALIAVGVPALADDTPAPELTSDHVTSVEQTDAEEYWTAERMAAAQEVTPEDVGLDADAARAKAQPAASTGAARTVQAQVANSSTDSIGKVFFSTSRGDFVCSANIVTSQNESTIATAGHCLHDGGGGDFATNFVFAPAYDHGEHPEYGVWAAEELVTSRGWAEAEDMNVDLGFAKLEEHNGVSIEDVVGDSTGIAFNQERGGTYAAYGYPAAAPFDGESLESCYGTATDDMLGGTQSQGIPCDMTGGSSGGPWFLGGDGGPQNSVNSFGYDLVPNTMYGPYYGDVAEDLYTHTSTL